MYKRTLGDMLRFLVSEPADRPSEADLKALEAKVVSLRPDIELRYFLEQKASQLGGVSLHALVISMLKAYQKAEEAEEYNDLGRYAESVSMIAGRIRYLFSYYEYSIHEVMAALGGFGVTPAIFQDDLKLVDYLPEEAYEELADAFLVQRSWLTGAKDETMREHVTFRHNSRAVLEKILELSESGVLERVIPFCRSTDLDGNKLIYPPKDEQVHGEGVYVGLAIKCHPLAKYKHARFKTWDTIPFSSDAAREEYKALLLELYQQFPGGSNFQGQQLSNGEWDAIENRRQPIQQKPLDDLSNCWDPEYYIGATWGENPGLC